ncbi:hypothetical protein WOC76_07075 [Methylocystis sp. IM3]|uniref:hypothetical protein n=1 Tax=unclassified Methylocystis TaxID=2625913 RepID=UPI0030F56E28
MSRYRVAGSALARWRASPSESPADGGDERRSDKRRGVSLNWGKALDTSDRFLCDCLVLNRSHGGARLRLARKLALPTSFHFFDDAEAALFAGSVVWRQGDIVGCRLTLEPLHGKEEAVKRMSGRYYAL